MMQNTSLDMFFIPVNTCKYVYMYNYGHVFYVSSVYVCLLIVEIFLHKK